MIHAELDSLADTLRDLPTSYVGPFNGHPVEDLIPKVELVETDGIPMDSAWHRMCMDLLLAVIAFHFRDRDDYYAGGNMFIYFAEDQARNHDYRGPDFFFVRDTHRMPIRPYWCVWLEDGKYPNAIIELLSPTTARYDLTIKKEIYETKFRTPEYFCYYPVNKQLFGWRLEHGVYQPIVANEAGRMWSEEIGLWLGLWEGDVVGYTDCWLRFFDDKGAVVMTETEYARQEAATVKQQALVAEAEVERLKNLLAELGKPIT